MIGKLKKSAIIKKLIGFFDEFFELIRYNFLIFGLTVCLVIATEQSETINPYLFSFCFIITIHYLLRYLLSCKEIKNLKRNNSVPLYVFILGGFLAIIGLWTIIQMLMQVFYGNDDILNQIVLDKRYRDNKAMQIPMTIHTIIFAPIMEEIVYRGLLLNAIMFFGSKCNFQKKQLFLVFMTLSSVLFGIVHLSDNFLTFIGFALTGLILASLYLLSGRIVVPMTVHFINNLSTSFGMDDQMKRVIVVITLLLTIGLIEYLSPKVKEILL